MTDATGAKVEGFKSVRDINDLFLQTEIERPDDKERPDENEPVIKDIRSFTDFDKELGD